MFIANGWIFYNPSLYFFFSLTNLNAEKKFCCSFAYKIFDKLVKYVLKPQVHKLLLFISKFESNVSLLFPKFELRRFQLKLPFFTGNVKPFSTNGLLPNEHFGFLFFLFFFALFLPDECFALLYHISF